MMSEKLALDTLVHSIKSHPLRLALLCLSVGLLSACGVKPDKLASPEANDKTPFPSTYPQPEMTAQPPSGK